MSTLVLTGGSVLLPDLSVETADVLIDQETGRIAEIGPDLEGDTELDAAGGIVMPGLVNAHCHVAMTLLRGYADDKPLRRWLEDDIWPVEAHLTAEDVRAGAELGILEMIKSGTTAFADMYFYEDVVAEVVDSAGLRALLGRGIVTVGKSEAEGREDLEAGVEFATDYQGAANGRIQTALMPHSLATVGEDFLRELTDQARSEDLPIQYHANETIDHQVEPVVTDHGMRPIEYASELNLLGSSVSLAHCVHLSNTELTQIAESDTSVVHCPASNMKLASGMAPVQRLLDAGVSVGIGTDGAASNNDLDMFDELCDAAMVGKLAAEDASAVDAATAIEMGTTAGAEILGFDGGRIEAGAVADVSVIDFEAPHLTPNHNSVSDLIYAASGSDVRHTICDGDVLMRDREVLTLDADRIITHAADQARDLLARANS